MTPTDLGIIIIFITVGYALLQGTTWAVRRLLKLDSNEREQLLQNQINSLMSEVAEYKKKVSNLERQVEVLVMLQEETAGKFTKLQDAYNTVISENAQLQNEVVSLAGIKKTKAEKILFVIIGSDDSGLSLDLASIRAVQSETGLEIKEVINPTPGSLKREMDQARSFNNQIYLHMAVRADQDGYQLGHQIVDATWLSSILNDVIVLLVAGTDSSFVGEFLGVVPYVVTMSGGIANRDASLFSRAFWTEIGKGIGPTRALKKALDKSPNIKDQIVAHWQD